jgi:hypothetical protein
MDINQLEEEQSLSYVSRRKPERLSFTGKGPNSRRAYFIELTAQMLGVPFKTVLWKTITWPEEWIVEMYSICIKSDNPPRLWWGLIKKSKKQNEISKTSQANQP